MKKARIIAALLMAFVTMPIWFYLLYKILQTVHATELMWFLYWIYVPVALLAGVLFQVTTKSDQ